MCCLCSKIGYHLLRDSQKKVLNMDFLEFWGRYLRLTDDERKAVRDFAFTLHSDSCHKSRLVRESDFAANPAETDTFEKNEDRLH